MTSILLIDDEPDIVKDILFNYGYDVEVAYDALSGVQAMLKPGRRYDIVILDLQLPKMDGWSVLKAIREGDEHPEIPVIMLTSANTEHSMMSGLRRGADLYLTKPITPGVLLAQIEALMRRTHWDKKASQTPEQGDGNKSPDLLTPRETEILQYIVQGLSNQEIGTKLSISETTVKNHLANIYKKLEVSNRNQAAFMAQKLKLF